MPQHPILTLLNKKVRAARKKVDKIRALEDSIVSGKLVNEQQREVLSHKYTSEKLLSEFESIHAQCQEYLKLEQAASSNASTTSTNSEKDTTTSGSSSSSSCMENPAVVVVVEEEEEKEDTPEVLMECKETMTIEAPAMMKTKDIMIKEDIIPDHSSMDAVQQILEVIHVVTLHQALDNPVPSPLDFFMKTLCGKSRPPAEISFDENLMESLEEAKRYLGASEKVVACEMTYAQLRETIRTLVCPPSPSKVEEIVSPVKSPQFNFFTESQLIVEEDNVVVVVGEEDTGPEVDTDMSEPAQAPTTTATNASTSSSSSSRKSSSSRGQKHYRPVSKDNHHPPSQTKPNTTAPAGKPHHHHHHSKETSAGAHNHNPNNKQHRRPRSARQTSNNSRSSSSGGKQNHHTMKNSAPSSSTSS